MSLTSRSLRRGLVALLVLIVLVVAWRFVASRGKAEAGSAAPSPGASAPTALLLAPGDVWTVKPTALRRVVEVTGSLKARESAFVKARVAGELQSLGVREGDAVRAGQVLGQIDTTELDWRLRQAEQQAESAKAQLDVAERTLTNNRALVQQGFISATALDTSSFNATGARATVQAAQSAVELARKTRADATLIAPLSGVVSQRLAQPGERVAVDAKLLEIVDISRLEMEAAVPPQELGRLRVGAVAELQVEGVEAPVAARLVRINPSTSAGSRSILAYLSIAGQGPLRQGLFAQGRIDLGSRNTLAVPTSAIRLDQPEPSVLVLESGQAIRRTVRLGSRGLGADGTPMTELLSGVSDGTAILNAQAGLVRSGTPVALPGAVPRAASGPSAAPFAASAAH